MLLERDKIEKILAGAPAGTDKSKLLDGLVQRGFELEGVDMQKARNRVQGFTASQEMQGNQFDQAREPQGFFGKARNFATSLIGGGKLAEGAGVAIGANKIQQGLGNAQQSSSDIQLQLVKTINEKKANGEDTTRLENALDSLNISQAQTSDTQKDFTGSLPTNKEVLGSALRLGGTLAGGAIAGGVSKGGSGTLQAAKGLQKGGGFAPATQATGFLSGVGQGAKVGALTGATEGAIQGAGLGLEQNKDALGVAGSALGGATIGGVTGGVVGGTIGGVTGQMNKTRALQTQREALLQSKPDSTVAKYTLDGQGRIATDPIAQETIKQGVDEGIVATMKGSSNKDKQKGLQALDILQKGKVDPKYGALNRPSDVIGDSSMERFNHVYGVNQEAGKQLDAVAGSLKGQKVNPTQAVQSFIDDLDNIGVKFQNGKPVYKGSDIEGLKEPQRILDAVIKRMSEVSDDANELHKLKRFIDENIAYGRAGEGLSGRAEGIVRGLRANIDELLDTNFSNYNQVNTQYAETRNAIDNFAQIAGTRFDPKSPNANKKLGTLARRILSNAQSRTDVLDSLNELQDVATKYGGKFDDDIVTQTIFVNELERLFGTSAPTSIAGEFTKGIDKARGIAGKLKSSQGLFDLALQATGEGIDKARNINEKALVNSLRQLLSN